VKKEDRWGRKDGEEGRTMMKKEERWGRKEGGEGGEDREGR
jgi:hypothetical protein